MHFYFPNSWNFEHIEVNNLLIYNGTNSDRSLVKETRMFFSFLQIKSEGKQLLGNIVFGNMESKQKGKADQVF